MKRSLKPAKILSVASNYSCGIRLLLLLLVMPFTNEASTSSHPKQNNWFISGSTGIVIRSGEFSEDYKFAADGFRHYPGFAYELSFGRTFGNKWEPAIRCGAYTLFGQSDLPHYSSAGYYAANPSFLEQQPLEYVTQSNSVSLILRFLFNDGGPAGSSAVIFQPFIEAGLGINNFSTELRYSKIPAGESSSLIYRERNGENANGGAQIVSGLGLKIGEQGEWNGVILLNAEWVEFSRLNALHHISNREIINSRAIVSRITAGITIPIRRMVKSDNFLPFRW